MANTQANQDNARAENVKKTLENKFFQQVLGSNVGSVNKSQYGTLAEQGIDNAYNSMQQKSEFNDLKKKVQDKYREMGVFGEVNTGAVSSEIISQIKSIQQMATLGELERYAKGIGAQIDFEVPEDIKDKSYMEIVKNLQEDQREPTDDEKNAIQMYEVLTRHYERASVIGNTDYFADLNQAGKKIAESYNEGE